MSITAIGEIRINSTVITNEVYNSFLFGNYIDQDAKDRISNKLSHYNLFGEDMNYGIFFSQKLDSLGKGRATYYIKLANRQHFNASFTKDLLHLGLYGNKKFAGDTLFLGSTGINSISYQQLQFGLAGVTNNNSIWGAGISFLKGQNYYHVNLQRANLYTNPTGEFIDLDLKMNVVQSDTAQRNWDALNGWGISTDLFYELPYDLLGPGEDTTVSDWTGYLRMEINDLGFIHWNSNTINYLSDTTYHFEGIYFENILALNDSVLERMTDSVADSYLPTASKGTFTTFLPGWIHFSMYQENAAGYSISLGTYLRLLANYSPSVYMELGRTFKENYKFTGMIEFGGYGKINLGLKAKARWGGFSMDLGTRNICAWILPKYTRGNSLYISISKDL